MRSLVRGAEGFCRGAFTVKEALAVREPGIVSENENSEPIEGSTNL